MGLRLHRSHSFKVRITRFWYKLRTSSELCQFQFLANGAWRALYFQDLEEITIFWYISTYDSSLAPCHNWLLHWVQGYTANLYCPLQESLRFPASPWALESTRNPTSLFNSMPIMDELCRYYICRRYSVRDVYFAKMMQLFRDLLWKNQTTPEQKTCEHILAFLKEYHLNM